MLDLSSISGKQYYDVRLLDGTELHIQRPTQAMVEYTLQIQSLAQDDNKQAETINALAQLFTRILNRNTEGKTFQAEAIAEEYDFQTIGYVIEDYFNFWNSEVNANVNFQQSQQN